MPVFRIDKSSNYTTMSNFHFREKEMSLKAKGLLSLMLSLPDDWDYSINGLCTLSKDGRDSVMNALGELEQFGYLVRTRVTDKKGKFAGYDYNVFEKPNTEEPNTEKPNTEKPNTEKPLQLNTNESNTNESRQERKTARRQPKASFDALIKQYSKGDPEVERLLGEWLKVRKAKRAAMTDYAIELNLKKLDNLAAESCMSVTEYLKEVICRGWNAFYAINNYNNGGSNYGRNQQGGSKGSNGSVNGADTIKWNDSLFV